MSAGQAATAVIAGIGACLPERLVKNEEVSARLGLSDDWIRDRTGIEQRYVSAPHEATSDLAVDAGRRALDSCGNPDVDFVLLATCTPDSLFPATAPSVAARLGLKGVPAFDMNAACSGFIYALTIASSMIATGAFRSALVIGAEVVTPLLDQFDQVTSPVFGDGAGAVVLRRGEPGEPGSLLEQVMGSDGDLLDILVTPGGGSRMRVAGVPLDPDTAYLKMQGRLVYKYAVKHMAAASEEVLARTGWRPEDVDHLVAHQANRRILTATASAIGVPAERAVVNVERVANTSAASIPLALVDAMGQDRFKPGDRILFCAFGGGVTWAAATLVWPGLPATAPL
ncbi:ketoacyl-ACP synthase III [Actinocorallia sp. API 0066]|uniref:3-oxoacyl-ACP synthase III family protein n=1 Tax=Actinocorallia sp. API 0066 TaxID=2896846 RepID=UPI001E5ADD85|nr:beta-ketoacyl-ACP synthase III [Actinocorallia sp. API 0066]MCD0449347.1 ketoacyl-ACP synthase III [Actinocorallia sp. API 0066]